jgi:hypothetical protein
MTVDELRKMLRAQPFRPFAIHIADGRALPVNHPERYCIVPRWRTIAVGLEDGIEIVDVKRVAHLKLREKRFEPRGRGKRRRK